MANEDDFPVKTGGFIPGSDSPAFSMAIPRGCPVPIVIAAPHGGRTYPEDLVTGMRDAKWSSLRLEDRFVDRLATEIARLTGAAMIVAHAPRAMLDLNRASDDLDWGMIEGGAPRGQQHSLANRRARSGLGLVPRRLSGLGEIWKGPLSRAELDARIEGVHRPYHSALARMLEEVRDRWGAALLLDLHSMPPLKPGIAGEPAAEFVLGDRFGTTSDVTLVASAFRYFARSGRPAAHNRPYAGGYVLDRHAAPARGIHAMQIEICRSLYLDKQFDQPTARLGNVARLLARLVQELARDVAEMGHDRGMPLAAE